MGFGQLIDKGPDLIKTQFGGSVRVEHCSVVDMFTLACQRGFDNQRLDIDVGLHECREMRGQRANFGGLEAILIHKTWNFHTATLRQIINESLV